MTAATLIDRPHGSHVCYVHGPDRAFSGKGCRCEPCRAANRDYERERARRVAPAYVDATEARQHIVWLNNHGLGVKTIATAAGISHGAISKLIYGDYVRGRPPSKRIRKATQDAILTVRPADAADGAKVPAGPVLADVAELVRRGWSKAAIARAIGDGNAVSLQLGKDLVMARNARAIRALLDAPVPPRRSRHGEHPVPAVAPLPASVRRDGPAQLEVMLPTIGPDVPVEVLAKGACRLPNIPGWIFFPGPGDRETIAAAKAVCATCPVVEACLTHAVHHEEMGVWGGTTERARLLIRRELKLTTPAQIRHGSNAGYRTHLRRDEKPCEPCRIAHRIDRAENRERQPAS